MKHFWGFAGWMLRYRMLLATGMTAAVLDAACAFGGWGGLLWVINQLFSENNNVRQIAVEKLSRPEIQKYFGDLTPLADYIPSSQFGGFAFILAIILAFALCGSILRFLHQACAITVCLRTIMVIRKEAFQRLIHAPLEYLLIEGSADNLSRIVRDSSQLSRGFNALMAKAVRNVLMGGALLIWAVIINWQLSLIFFLGLPVIYISIRKFGKRIRRASKYALRAYGGMLAALQEAVQGIVIVKVHNAEGYERRRFNTINRKILSQELKARTARALSAPVIEMIGIVGVMAVSLFAAWNIYQHGIGSPGDIATVLMSLGAAGASLKPLANLNNDLQESAAAATRLHQLIHAPVEPNTRNIARQTQHHLPRHQHEIRYQNITYYYPHAKEPALRDADLIIKHGTTTAIVGPNGSGKSTLINLLPRLIVPRTGHIYIDGQDIAQVSLRSIRKQIAMVTQKTVLFGATIAENIAYGRNHMTIQDIMRAAEAAFAHEFISSLHDGYHTVLNEGGEGLSGGQKQRICIARAILRNPAVLILDEATSQIDSESESKINRALSNFKHGRTILIIAHRLSTVVNADLIVVMSNGRIIDQGTHRELLDRSSVYQSITHHQLQHVSQDRTRLSDT